MAGKKQKKQEEAPAGAPLWIVTFSDLMSLLLTFFVLLLSFSSIQEVEFQKALGSLKGALGVLPRNDAIYSPVKTKFPKAIVDQKEI
ncbi:MAG: flagellar motor protein MotB [Calditrichia bacterium]